LKKSRPFSFLLAADSTKSPETGGLSGSQPQSSDEAPLHVLIEIFLGAAAADDNDNDNNKSNKYQNVNGIRDSAVGTATDYGLDDRWIGVRVPVGSRIFFSPRRPDRL
jgi:hypothetical protein